MKRLIYAALALVLLGACVPEQLTEPELQSPQFSVTSSDWHLMYSEFNAALSDTESAEGSWFSVDVWWGAEYEFGPGVTGQYAIDQHRWDDFAQFKTDINNLRSITDNEQSWLFEAAVVDLLDQGGYGPPYLYLLHFMDKMADGYDHGPSPWDNYADVAAHMSNARYWVSQANGRIGHALLDAEAGDWQGVADALREEYSGVIGAGRHLNEARLEVLRAQLDLEAHGRDLDNPDKPYLVLGNLQAHLYRFSRALGHVSDALYIYHDATSGGPPEPPCDPETDPECFV